jgi:hypothetical protein
MGWRWEVFGKGGGRTAGAKGPSPEFWRLETVMGLADERAAKAVAIKVVVFILACFGVQVAKTVE